MTGIDAGKAQVPDVRERLLRFPHLDVAVPDGVVYTTTGGLLPLGPLAGAAAAFRGGERALSRAGSLSACHRR